MNVERRLLGLTGLEELLTGGGRRVPRLTETLVRELSERKTGVGVDVGMPGAWNTQLLSCHPVTLTLY